MSTGLGIYNQALARNQSQYQAVMNSYSSNLGAITQSMDKTLAGYGQLSDQVQKKIAGMDASQRQGIQDQYVAGLGQQNQMLTNRGLGNTTVANSVQRGLMHDKAKADIELTNKTQNVAANYLSQLGLAKWNYAGQGLRDLMGASYQMAGLGARASDALLQGGGDMARMGYQYDALSQQKQLEQQRMAQQAQLEQQRMGMQYAMHGNQMGMQYAQMAMNDPAAGFGGMPPHGRMGGGGAAVGVGAEAAQRGGWNPMFMGQLGAIMQDPGQAAALMNGPMGMPTYGFGNG